MDNVYVCFCLIIRIPGNFQGIRISSLLLHVEPNTTMLMSRKRNVAQLNYNRMRKLNTNPETECEQVDRLISHN